MSYIFNLILLGAIVFVGVWAFQLVLSITLDILSWLISKFKGGGY